MPATAATVGTSAVPAAVADEAMAGTVRAGRRARSAPGSANGGDEFPLLVGVRASGGPDETTVSAASWGRLGADLDPLGSRGAECPAMDDLSVTVLALLGLAGLAAGFVDAVVGGGGLIQLPAVLLGLPNASPVQVLATKRQAGVDLRHLGEQRDVLPPGAARPQDLRPADAVRVRRIRRRRRGREPHPERSLRADRPGGAGPGRRVGAVSSHAGSGDRAALHRSPARRPRWPPASRSASTTARSGRAPAASS